jgi:hypothetical protein
MNVYQIALPASLDSTPSPAGGYLGCQLVSKWVEHALKFAAGYTYLGKRLGAWRDEDTGDLFTEQMHWYEVACDRDVWDVLVAYAFQLFPNELAIYTARVGECEIIVRPKISGGE